MRALTYTAMVTGNIALVFSNRTLDAAVSNSFWQASGLRKNPVLWWIVLGVSAALALVLSAPVLCGLFHFYGDVPYIFGVGVLAACCVLLLSAGVKRTMGIASINSLR